MCGCKIHAMNKPFVGVTPHIFLFIMLIAVPACEAFRELRQDHDKTTDRRETSSPRKTDKKAELRREVVSYAQQLKGSQYTAAGKNPKSGFDCSGFTGYVLRNFDIEMGASSRDQATQGRTVPLKEGKPGDLIFFRRSSTTPVFHEAMIVSNDSDGIKMIHSTNTRGVVVDNLLQNSYWEPKIYQVRDVLNN